MIFPEIVTKFHPGRQTTLADCEVEVKFYGTENRGQDLDDCEGRMKYEAVEGRATQVSAVWRNAIKHAVFTYR